MNPSPYATHFSSAHLRARIVKILLIVGAVVTGVAILAQTLSLAFPPVTGDEELGDNPAGVVLVLLIFSLVVFESIIYLTTVVFFLLWLYRAANNVRAFNQWNRLEHSAGWAVGSFFIPIVNLFVPYRAVKEVWQKSTAPDEAFVVTPEAPATFPVWWLFWLLAGFASKISFRLSLNDNVPESTSTLVSIIAGVLSIVAAVFAYLVVDAIDKRQEETSLKVNLRKFPEPPPPPPNLSMPDTVPVSGTTTS